MATLAITVKKMGFDLFLEFDDEVWLVGWTYWMDGCIMVNSNSTLLARAMPLDF